MRIVRPFGNARARGTSRLFERGGLRKECLSGLSKSTCMAFGTQQVRPRTGNFASNWEHAKIVTVRGIEQRSSLGKLSTEGNAPESRTRLAHACGGVPCGDCCRVAADRASSSVRCALYWSGVEEFVRVLHCLHCRFRLRETSLNTVCTNNSAEF